MRNLVASEIMCQKFFTVSKTSCHKFLFTMYTCRKENDTLMFNKIDNTIIRTVKNFSFITT